MKTILLVGFSLSLLTSSVVQADSIRCGTKIITVGSTKVDVLMRCGDPLLKEHLRTKVKGGSAFYKNPAIAPSTSLSTNNGALSANSNIEKRRIYRSSVEDVERWTYDFGKGRLLKMFIFTAGELSAIEDGERMN